MLVIHFYTWHIMNLNGGIQNWHPASMQEPERHREELHPAVEADHSARRQDPAADSLVHVVVRPHLGQVPCGAGHRAIRLVHRVDCHAGGVHEATPMGCAARWGSCPAQFMVFSVKKTAIGIFPLSGLRVLCLKALGVLLLSTPLQRRSKGRRVAGAKRRQATADLFAVHGDAALPLQSRTVGEREV